MLKNVPAILSPDLLYTLRAMGHGDELAIVDANFPAEYLGPEVIRADGSSATDILNAVLSLLPLDDFVDHAAIAKCQTTDLWRI
jgi:L-fucose mutarotase